MRCFTQVVSDGQFGHLGLILLSALAKIHRAVQDRGRLGFTHRMEPKPTSAVDNGLFTERIGDHVITTSTTVDQVARKSFPAAAQTAPPTSNHPARIKVRALIQDMFKGLQ